MYFYEDSIFYEDTIPKLQISRHVIRFFHDVAAKNIWMKFGEKEHFSKIFEQ